MRNTEWLLPVAYLFLLGAFVTSTAVIADDKFFQAGICAGCHGIDGNSGSPMWPNLAGQDQAYLIKQMQTYHSGMQGQRRLPESDQMYVIARTLSDEEIRRYARFYAGQPRSRQTPGHAEPGAMKLYSGKGQCLACHGENAEGMAAIGAPMLAGQHARYTARQLRAYRDGLRFSTDAGMTASVKDLTDDEIVMLAKWLEALAQP